MRRRTFLQSTAAAGLALASVDQLFAIDADNKYRKNIGIQMYTLRNELKADTPGTMKAVADAGYKQVELYGYPNSDAMIKSAKDNGLAIHSTHFAWNSVVNPDDKGNPPFQKILDQAKDAGFSHLV